MIHLNTHLSRWNEDVNDVDDSFEHTLIKEKWEMKMYMKYMIHLNTHLSKRNEDVNEVDDSFEHTLIKGKWICKWSRWFIWTHTYQGEMKM